MNPHQIYEAGYGAGLEGDDSCPYFPFTLAWWTWHAGQFVGHEVRCAQYAAIIQLFPQD